MIPSMQRNDMNKNRSSLWKLLSLWILFLVTTLFAGSGNIASIVKVTGYSTQTDVSLCASLNKFLYGGDGVAAKQFIELSPKQSYRVKLSYNGICLKGLKPRTHYRFTIHKGIPLGEFRLDRDYTLSGTTGDYTPSLQFDDHGYILPAKGEITIPIKTINVKEISVSLYRINTKNLIGKINDYGLLLRLYSEQADKIASTEGFFLWEKRLRIRSDINQPKVTAIPVGDFLKKRKPGVYILKALEVGNDGKPVNRYRIQTQWFMVSDLGLYTMKGDDGLTVYTRHLSNAEIYDDVKLELISKNNELLDKVVTKKGKAFFADKLLNGKRGLKPKAIYAYGKADDFSVIDLGKAPLDLSDRGVQGRENPGRYDAYIYSDRGIFRPGESVPIEILLRNRLGEAQGGMKLSMKLLDSREVEVQSRLLETDELGHISTKIELPASSSTGKWHLGLYAGESKAVGKLDFLVEDFVPPKIAVDIKSSPSALKPGQKGSIELNAHYLSGEALPDAGVEATTILHQVKKPFKRYELYHFGDMTESFGNRYLQAINVRTDRQGNASVPFAIDEVPHTSLPLSAHITLSVSEPGGRPVKKVIECFVKDKAGYIGIKPDFENDAVDMGSRPTFELIYLRDAHLASKDLHYRVVREQVHWNWHSNGDDWTYTRSYSDAEEVSSGIVKTSAGTPVTLKLPRLDWGSYRLEVKEEGEVRILSTYRFGSGYEMSTSKASPDRLPISVDKHSYLPGEKLRVHITPKFSGPIMVTVADNTLLETRTVQALAGEEIELAFTAKKRWGSGVYILASAFRAQSGKLGASRAVGVAYISIEDPGKVIELSMDYPARVKSFQPVKVRISAEGLAGEKAYFVLSAVDEGILRLTNFRTPDPAGYFYGQQKLGLEIRDIYGELIEAHGAHAQFNVGAGEDMEGELREKVTPNKRKVVALFSGPAVFDSQGHAEILLNIPDYQGALRLMAVAWSQKSVGAQSGELVVKDTVSPEIYMPGFISVGDRAKGLLSVSFDKDAKAGEYTIRYSSHNAKGVIDKHEYHFRFDASKAAMFKVPVVLRAPSYENIMPGIEVLLNGKVLVSKEWELAVRSRYPELSTKRVGLIPGDALFDPQALYDSGLWSDPHAFALRISGKPLIAAEALADDLIGYWGHCAEQTVSRAMPWLFMPTTSPLAKKINTQAITAQAIEQLLAYQKLDGGFGLWSGSGAEMWISAYVLDFLTRARKAGYTIPERSIRSGLNWIENHLDRWSSVGAKQEADAYGLYVLTRNKRTLMTELLYRSKTKKSAIRSAQAWAHLAASLAYVGENDRARGLFKKAAETLGNESGGGYFGNYGGMLRDEAALTILMQESGLGLDWQTHYADLASSAAKRDYLSTQEESLLLRAAFVVNIPTTKLKLIADGKELPLKHGEFFVTEKDLHRLPLIRNESGEKSWYSFTFKATPKEDAFKKMQNSGFTIEKKIYTLDGTETDLSVVRQNTRLVVVIQGAVQNSQIENPLVTDWIPAGFELENPSLNGIDPTSGLKWLGRLSGMDHIEYRNDRYIAVLSNKGAKGFFRVAYVCRAVTPGKFTLPPAIIEDMYRPYYRAVALLHSDKVEIREGSVVSRVPSQTDRSSGIKKLTGKDFEMAYTRPVQNLDRYTITQLNYLRNSIFARAGLDYKMSNPALFQLFSNYGWYHPDTASSGRIYKALTSLQKENVQKLLTEEKRRGGGLVLKDFYRVRVKLLSEKDLEKYDRHQLAILRNSLFARRGVAFKNEEYRRIFSCMPWYHPTDISSAEVFDEQMSEQEKANVTLIRMMEKSKR